MKKIISGLHFAWHDVGEALDRAVGDWGLDGVEWSWHPSFSRPHCTRADMAALADDVRVRSGGHSAHIWEDFASLAGEESARALDTWLGFCQATGIRRLVVHGGAYPDRAEGMARVRRVFESALPSLETAGVNLYLENHYAHDYRGAGELFSEPWEFERVFLLPSPNLHFCLDTGHAHMTHNGEALISELASRLHYVHLADNRGEHDDHLMFRRGTVPWDRYFDGLAAISFDGVFCVEFAAREDLGPFRECLAEIDLRWDG